MCQNHLKVSLGFTDEKVPVGTHMCIIYTGKKEGKDTLLNFLLSGLKAGERAACFSNQIDEETFRYDFAKNEICHNGTELGNCVSFASTGHAYFQDGVFNPEIMLKNLKDFYEESLALGFSASRVIGEMTPDVKKAHGGDRLLEYECRVTMLLRDHPVTSVCQYDANAFDGATIMEVLKVHPKMFVNGNVINNPFFIEPEKYLIGK